MEIVPVVDEGLGNSSYLVGLGDGGALVVDPFRDPSPYLDIAAQRGWRIRFAAETHLHADFVSGSRELTARGAQVLASAGAPLHFHARHLGDGDEVNLGGLMLRAVATPGHTPEHLSYLVVGGDGPAPLFSGGSLIVGGVARPDLLSDELTEPLARSAYRSLRDRLLSLPDETPLYPTHGAGSFCSTGAGGERTSTIGAERSASPLLQAAGESDFAARLLDSLGSFPPYFLELREVNRAGPRVYGTDPPPPARLGPDDVEDAVDAGAALIDVRSIRDFGAGHIPGSLSIALRPQFATWLGWLVDRERALVFVADRHTDRVGLVRACLSIGYERILGELAGGIDAWEASGRPAAQIPVIAPEAADGSRRVIDVRQRSERESGQISGALGIELGELGAHAGELGDGPALVHCEHGERAMTGASLLTRAGQDDVQVLAGGAADLAEATGRRLDRAG